MDTPNDPRLFKTLKLLRERPAAGEEVRSSHGSRLEGAGGGVGGLAEDLHPDDVLARLDEVVNSMPAGEVGDPAAFKQAYAMLQQHGETALKKILQPSGASTELHPDEMMSLEAVVVADGTRPSFLLREGNVAADHPFLGIWKDDVTDYQSTLRKLAACVGRIQPAQGGPGNFNGTGVLVDAGELLVLTNFHVVQHARNTCGIAMESGGNHLKVKGEWFIDFVGEVDSEETNLWMVKEVRLPANVDVSFKGVDAAVLRIEPIDDEQSKLPEPAIVCSGDLNYASGSRAPTLATVGYPGQPDTRPREGVSVNWDFVVKTLFNNLFGLKRMAPGRFEGRIGTIPGDTFGHVLSHDATTFGGASGSPVFAWKDEKSPAFALHFAGETLTANYAISLHKTRAALLAIGVPIT